MRIRIISTKPLSKGLCVQVEIRYRQASWLKTLWLPWSVLAADEVVDQVQRERDAQHRPLEDTARPWLPLEKWE